MHFPPANTPDQYQRIRNICVVAVAVCVFGSFGRFAIGGCGPEHGRDLMFTVSANSSSDDLLGPPETRIRYIGGLFVVDFGSSEPICDAPQCRQKRQQDQSLDGLTTQTRVDRDLPVGLVSDFCDELMFLVWRIKISDDCASVAFSDELLRPPC